MTPEEDKAVEYFLSVYFHQDWAHDYGSVGDAVTAYRNDVEPAEVGLALAGIEELRRMSLDDPEHLDLYERYGCYLVSTRRRKGDRYAWLDDAVAHLKE